MNKNLLITLGILMLTLSACGTGAEATPVEPVSAPEVSVPAESAPVTDAPAIAEPPAPAVESSPAPAQPAAGVSYAGDIAPIFSNSCNNCHGIDQVKAGLDMTSYESLKEGSFDGAVIVPGDAAGSSLVELIASGKMPKRGDKLSDGQIQIISDWINAGAPNN